MTTLLRYMIVALALATATPTSGALLLYSVDTTTDELVTIDAATGSVTTIGSLSEDVSVDLTAVGGRLFGLDFKGQNVGADLLEINPFTGQLISRTAVTHNGNQIAHGEGLGHVGNKLKIGYSQDNLGNNRFSSETLGDLALDGTITNVVSFNPLAVDFDGLGFGSGNLLYWADSFGPNGNSDNDLSVFSLDESNNTNALIAQFNDDPTIEGMNDLLSVGSTLYGLARTSDGFVIRAIDLNDGSLIGDTVVDGDGLYTGLAHVIPEPSTYIVFTGLILCIGLAGWWRKRRRTR